MKRASIQEVLDALRLDLARAADETTTLETMGMDVGSLVTILEEGQEEFDRISTRLADIITITEEEMEDEHV